jgi:hypothetical protein
VEGGSAEETRVMQYANNGNMLTKIKDLRKHSENVVKQTDDYI